MNKFFHTDAATSGIPIRTEVRVEDTWDLTLLYPDAAAWENDFLRMQELFPGITAFRGRLAEGPFVVHQALLLDDEVSRFVERLVQFAGLKASEDSANEESLSREARLEGGRPWPPSGKTVIHSTNNVLQDFACHFLEIWKSGIL